MYLKKINIKNIGCVDKLELEFSQLAGWHVLIGDNGAGKSTILRAIALALVGNNKIEALRLAYAKLIRSGEERGEIELTVSLSNPVNNIYRKIRSIIFEKTSRNGIPSAAISIKNNSNLKDEQMEFSASFGPFRRFTGGNKEWENLYISYPKVAAHLSLFGEDIALTESINWLINLNYKKLEKKEDAAYTLKNLKRFINESTLLPQNVRLEQISSEGVSFRDGNGVSISVTEMSDGFRSILSLIFELIRQLVFTFGAEKIFQNISKGEINIDIPGVVLIDEIDAHLHPTWQTRIGQCLTSYFPSIQFIVTTHSPLVCRAAENGSIWRLTAPGSNQETYQIVGVERDRLIYGNILEAMGTASFGNNIERSNKSQEMLQQLSNLEVQHTYGKLSEKDVAQMNNLRKIFTTDDTINL